MRGQVHHLPFLFFVKIRTMNIKQLEYTLPEQCIAHAPTEPRDHAKLVLLNKRTGEIEHKHFYDLPTILTSQDVLVFNNTKVFPARLYAGKIEILLLREVKQNIWTAMHRGKLRVGDTLDFSEIHAKVTDKKEYEITLQFIEPKEIVLAYIEEKGQIPLPPYIHTSLSETEARDKYQTVYAKDTGSVAAPTAGLHFTKELIQSIKDSGIQIEQVTLHVGAGTFLPIKAENLEKHHMHSEYYSLEASTVKRLNEAKKNNKRIVAVGTTTTRVLESIALSDGTLSEKMLSGSTDIFIYPSYKFKFVDSLITNFHLPHSTLLALVSAFVSKPNTENDFTNFSESIVGNAYINAQNNEYKFYSFGDGMMIG